MREQAGRELHSLFKQWCLNTTVPIQCPAVMRNGGIHLNGYMRVVHGYFSHISMTSPVFHVAKVH